MAAPPGAASGPSPLLAWPSFSALMRPRIGGRTWRWSQCGWEPSTAGSAPSSGAVLRTVPPLKRADAGSASTSSGVLFSSAPSEIADSSVVTPCIETYTLRSIPREKATRHGMEAEPGPGRASSTTSPSRSSGRRATMDTLAASGSGGTSGMSPVSSSMRICATATSRCTVTAACAAARALTLSCPWACGCVYMLRELSPCSFLDCASLAVSHPSTASLWDLMAGALMPRRAAGHSAATSVGSASHQRPATSSIMSFRHSCSAAASRRCCSCVMTRLVPCESRRTMGTSCPSSQPVHQRMDAGSPCIFSSSNSTSSTSTEDLLCTSLFFLPLATVMRGDVISGPSSSLPTASFSLFSSSVSDLKRSRRLRWRYGSSPTASSSSGPRSACCSTANSSRSAAPASWQSVAVSAESTAPRYGAPRRWRPRAGGASPGYAAPPAAAPGSAPSSAHAKVGTSRRWLISANTRSARYSAHTGRTAAWYPSTQPGASPPLSAVPLASGTKQHGTRNSVHMRTASSSDTSSQAVHSTSLQYTSRSSTSASTLSSVLVLKLLLLVSAACSVVSSSWHCSDRYMAMWRK
mmetsp:Transcript_22530/g.56611  ORF Transcript_22530/g.56611 Transcript_22530/m.56611 type:complete len:579 (-) Transcript_22530:697-2433(-)